MSGLDLKALRGYVYPLVLCFQLIFGFLQLLDYFAVEYFPMVQRSIKPAYFALGFSLVVPMAVLMLMWAAVNLVSGKWSLLFACAPLYYCRYSVELGISMTSVFMWVVGVVFLGKRGRFWDVLLWVLSFFLGLGVVHWGVLRPLGVASPFTGVAALMYNVHHVLRRMFPVLVLPFLFFWLLKPVIGLRWRLPELDVSEQEFDRFSKLLLTFSLFLSLYAAVYPYFPSVNLSSVEFGVDLPNYVRQLYLIEDAESGLTSGVGAQRLFFFLFIYGFMWVTGLGTYEALQSMPVLLNPLFVLASCYFSWEACRNGRVVAWCGFLSATGMTITVGLFAFFLNNLLALVIAFFSLGLLFKAVRLGDLRWLGVAALGGGLLVYTHPWTMDQLLAGLAPVLGLILYRKGPGYAEKAAYLGGYLGAVGVAEVTKVLLLGSWGGVAATSRVVRDLVLLEEVWSSLFLCFPYVYCGFISNLVLLVLATVGVYLLKGDDVFGRWLWFLVLLSSMVYFVSLETIKSRLLYNLPFGFFGALGLMWVCDRRGLPSAVFVVAYSLFYLYASVGSLTW